MVGSAYEAGGIAKDGAKLVAAVSTAAVPKSQLLSVDLMGRVIMACAGVPTALILSGCGRMQNGVMGGEQAAGVLVRVRRDAGQKGRPFRIRKLQRLLSPF